MKVPVMVWMLRVVCLLLLAALIGGCLWAQAQGGLWVGLLAIAREPWGAVTLTDLGAGLLVAATWMCLVERRRALLLLWLPGLLLLGNISTIAFLLCRTWGARDLRAVVLGDGRA